QQRGDNMAEVIVGYDERLYVHVDPTRGQVLHCVIDPTSAGGPIYVDGPEHLAERASALSEDGQAHWPAWQLG
ncbi:MAG: hypothetical protein M3433_00060, partial [Actinomycetota bacterium]|nr:hypothetical protein [Actinomycetota bacterium]